MIGGAGGVGKTTMLHRYLHNAFMPRSTMTIGVAFHSHEILRNGAKINLSLWDLGGQERFRFMQPSYVAGAKAGILFFDMSRLDTITQVKEWADMFRLQAAPEIPIILAGGKMDLVHPDMLDEVNNYAKSVVTKLGLSCYMPTSSKTGTNISEMFNHIVDVLVSQINQVKAVAAASID